MNGFTYLIIGIGIMLLFALANSWFRVTGMDIPKVSRFRQGAYDVSGVGIIVHVGVVFISGIISAFNFFEFTQTAYDSWQTLRLFTFSGVCLSMAGFVFLSVYELKRIKGEQDKIINNLIDKDADDEEPQLLLAEDHTPKDIIEQCQTVEATLAYKKRKLAEIAGKPEDERRVLEKVINASCDEKIRKIIGKSHSDLLGRP